MRSRTGKVGGPGFALLLMLTAAAVGAWNLPRPRHSAGGVAPAVPGVPLLETFDDVTAPALPFGWVATNAQGQNPVWATAASGLAHTPPNSAYLSVGAFADERLDSPPVWIATGSAQLRFQHAFAFNVDPGAHPTDIPIGFGWLEISIGGGAFQEIVAAGGSFLAGAYNGGSYWYRQNAFPPACCDAVVVNLPPATAGSVVVVRWRSTTTTGPNIPGGALWWVDGVQICDGYPCDAVPLPSRTDVDSTGNGVWEPGETVQVEPYYSNNGAVALGFTGSTTLTGPAGAAYTNVDSLASYASIDPGAIGGCTGSTTDCYAVSVDDPTVRPAAHWDAQLSETLSNGLGVTRVLHIGMSFADAPSSNPFYAFIETLLHNRVTGGCGGSNYCPNDSVTRGQMAVFLLKGRHGGSYVPPPCAATVFTDVPCPGGPFVDWVNQLAAEGITGGCGNGNYCPTNPVTRGQMSVFLLKSKYGGAYVPDPCSATFFDDVVCPGAQFVDFINRLAFEEITSGCGGNLYCPNNPNTRGQMAVFLVKTFAFPLYRP
jgi:hypothetical protein